MLQVNILVIADIAKRLLRSDKNPKNKEDKNNEGEHRSNNTNPTQFTKWKHLKGWVTIPIHIQIEDGELDRK